MAITKFPTNPTDGMIFEPIPGTFYQYNSKEKSWIRIDGISIGLATPLIAGLMSAEDLKKLNSLILPPPQTTLSGGDCPIEFKRGTVSLQSTDGSIIIEPSLENKGPGINQIIPWALHENTAGYNFRLNIDQFIQEIENRGKIKRILTSGKDGLKGPKGAPGIDNLDTGPEGPQGEAGDNAVWPGTFVPETVQFKIAEDQDGRAIVDISTEEIGDDNYIVLTRANIGNPETCTTIIQPTNFNSPWLLVIDKQENQTTQRIVSATNTSSGDECQLTCQICISELYHLNIESILDTIATRFNNLLIKLKFDTEKLARDWLKVMVSMFNEQKYALCCALENCESRKRNDDTRKYIEQQRIQAAQSKSSLVVDSNDDDFKYVPSQTAGNCDVPDEQIDTDSHVVYGTECDEYLITASLDAKMHNVDPRTGIRHRSLSARLPVGDYVLEIKDCCANLNNVKQYVPKPETPQRPSPTPPPPPGQSDNPPINVAIEPYLGPAIISGNAPPNVDATEYNPGLEFAKKNPGITVYAKPTGGLKFEIAATGQVVYTKTTPGVVPPGLRTPTDSIGGGDRGVGLPSGLSPSSLYGPGRYTGRVAMLYRQSLPSIDTGGDEETIQSVLEIPNLGEFEDLSMARHAYIGHSVGFSHAGGNITFWIPDPDRLASNNDGSIVIGIRSKKCYETETTEVINPSESEPLNIYVYRDDLSPDNLVTVILPYEATDLTHIENYGYDGSNANLRTGPALEYNKSKLFFVKTSDGLGFYFINSSNSGGLITPVSIKALVEGNSSTTNLIVADEPTDITIVDVSQGRQYTASWNVNNSTEGLVVGNLDEEQTDDWIITLDDLSFGDMNKLIAVSKSGAEAILAGGAQDDSIPTQVVSTQRQLCRSLIRACNVLDGFGGRYSLGVINRKKGNFRICKTISACDDFKYIRKPYIYAPYPEPCGARACDVKYEVVSGSDGKVLPINRISFNTNGITSGKLDMMFIIDMSKDSVTVGVSGRASEGVRFVRSIINDFVDSIKAQTSITDVRVGITIFGQEESGVDNFPTSNFQGHTDGNPIIKLNLTSDLSAAINALDTLVPLIGQGTIIEPGFWAIQYTTENAAWDDDAIKMITIITDENSDVRQEITKETVSDALNAKNVILNGILSKHSFSLVDSIRGTTETIKGGAETYGIPDNLNNFTDGGTGLIYEHNGTAFDIEDMLDGLDQATSLEQDPFGIPVGFEGDEESVAFHRLQNFRVEKIAELSGACARTKLVCDLQIDDMFGDLDFNDLNVRMHFDSRVPCAQQVGPLSPAAIAISDEFVHIGATQIDIDMKDYQDELNNLINATNQCTGINATPYLQPFRQLRIGIGATHDGVGYDANGDRIAIITGTNMPLNYDITAMGGSGFQLVFGSVIHNHIPFRGALVHLQTNATGNKILATCITDENGKYVLKMPTNFINQNNNLKVKIRVELYAFEFPTSSVSALSTSWTIDKPTKIADWKQLLKLSGGGLSSSYGTETTWHNNATIGITDGTVFSVRGITHRGGFDTSDGFYARFKSVKLDELAQMAPPVGADCTQIINGGPSAVYKTVEGILMTEATLDGRVIGISATVLAVPGTTIRTWLFDKFGRGVILKGIQTSEAAIWETHTWMTSSVDRFLVDNAPFEILLRDLVSLSFEFVNPDLGFINYFGQVNAVVERLNDNGEREVVLVDIATFEPFGNKISEPGEIPLVLYSSTPAEEDTSAYLENFWTIASSDISSSRDICTRLKEFCPECTVSRFEAFGVDGSVVKQEYNCMGGIDNQLVPLTKYLLTPIGPGESCLMFYKQIEWYERGWRIGACCGAKITIDGTTWLVVKRSIGTDISCGGGESETTKCIKQFIDSGEGHPALAWPTIDGEEFSGRPTSGFSRLVKDTGLSDQIRYAIATGSADEIRGNLLAEEALTTIPFILFPLAT